MEGKFAGKKVFVAGGTGGIGRAIAKAFLDDGADVFIQGRNQDKLDGLSGFAKEVKNSEDVDEIVNEVKNKLGGVDIFVSAIGSGKYKKTGLLSQEEWNEILMQNFFSSVLLIKGIVGLMNGSDPNIVLTGSIAGIERLNAPVGYTVAKAALHSYVRSMSSELAGRNIRINVVHPGNIYFSGGRWEELKNSDQEGTKAYIDSVVPQKRFGNPEDVAQAVLFLASQGSNFITGASIEVDGGQHVSF